MEVIILLLLTLIFLRIVRPSKVLSDFTSKTTVPLRGILALFIMLHHISWNYDLTFGLAFFERYQYLSLNLFRNTGETVTGVFFFLTGYGLAKSMLIKGKEYIKGFLRRRYENVVPEFVLLTFIATVYLVLSGEKTVMQLVMDMGYGIPPLPNSWFIYSILYVYSAFFVSAVCAGGRLKTLGVFFMGLLLVYILCIMTLNWGKWWYISLPSVSMGYFIAIYEKNIDKILIKRSRLLLVLILFVLLCVFGRYFEWINLLAKYMVVIVTYICMRLYMFPKCYPLIWLGEISLNIYLIHGIYVLWFRHYDINPTMALIGVVVLTCVSAYGLNIVRKYVNCKL